jgi:hypothetical protein
MSASAAVKMIISEYGTKRDERRTFDLRNLPLDDLFELPLGDAVAEDDGPLGEGLVAVDAGFEFVVDMHANAMLNTIYPSSESLWARRDTKEWTHLHHLLGVINNLLSALLHL